MRPVLFILTLLLSCGMPRQDPAATFLKTLNTRSPGIAVLRKNNLIPANTRFLKYPYRDISNSTPLSELITCQQPYFIFYLGKDYLTQCDICLSEQIDLVRQLAAAGNMPILFASDNRNSRDLAVFRNRHNLNNLYMLADTGRTLIQYDYACFILQIQ
jgi:hypothetical protein